MGRTLVNRRDLLREQLAHLAAKLMAESGISDHGHAKRKAARQLGIHDTQHLPSNEEINTALRSFRSLYQHQHHLDILKLLRQEALATMRMMAEFHPYLTGSVLDGTAGAQSDIELLFFADDAKAVLLFLLKNGIDFKDKQTQIWLEGQVKIVPSYTLIGESGSQIHILSLPESAHFSGIRKSATRANIAAVESLLAD